MGNNVIILRTDGSYELKRIEKQGDSSLRMMYRELDCSLVDVIRCQNDIDMWVNDSTPIEHQEISPVASVLARAIGDGRMGVWGTVFIAGVRGGETVGLSEQQQAMVKAAISFTLARMAGTNWN